MQSESIGALAEALSKAQGEMHAAKKDSENPFFKSNYADLESCWSALRAPLSKHNLAVIQTTKPCELGVTVVTTLVHSSGEWIRGELTMAPDKQTPQAIGSCITYARRYALCAIVGLTQDDDDGNATVSPTSDLTQSLTHTQQRPVAASTPASRGNLSSKQIARMMAIATKNKISVELLKEIVKQRYNKTSSKELTKPEYDELCDAILPNGGKA